MTILDTNVVSELLAASPVPAVLDWFDAIDVPDVAFTAITVMEIRHGISRLPQGRRRDRLADKFDEFSALTVTGVLSFDAAAAEESGRYLAMREQIGQPLSDHRDAMIAGIVLRLTHRDGQPATLATRNVRHFINLSVVNPWDT